MNIDIAEVDNEMQMTYVNAFRDTRLLIEEVLHDPESFINEHDRIIFDLKNVYCYTFMEIAEALGIARHKVHYRYYKITQHLTGQFKKRGINSLEDLL